MMTWADRTLIFLTQAAPHTLAENPPESWWKSFDGEAKCSAHMGVTHQAAEISNPQGKTA